MKKLKKQIVIQSPISILKKVKVGNKKTESKKIGIQGIRTQLLAGFMVPVVCLVLLGTISYNKASEIVIDTSVEDMKQTVHMMSEYYRSSLGFITSKIDEFYLDTQDYVDGDYAVSDLAAVQFYNSTQDAMKHVMWSDSNMNSVAILATKAKSILTNGKEDATMYEAFLATPEGQKVNEDRRNYHWFGRNPEVDAILGVEEGSYIFRCAMAYNKEEAFLISEVKEDLILSTMKTLDFG